MNKELLLSRNKTLLTRVVLFEEVDSTNDICRQLARQGFRNAVVIAGQQTAGRGRLGRAFLSPYGDGLYLSMSKPMPTHRRLPPTVLAACGVARALEGLIGRQVGVKWVNDLMLDGYKIAGILAEASGDCVVVGIGLNINNPQQFFLPELPHVSSLAARCKRCFSLEEAAAALVDEVDLAWEQEDDVLYECYCQRLVTLGKIVRVSDGRGGPERIGEAVALDDDAALLVRFADQDAIERVIVGDVSVRGIAGY